MTGPEDGRTVVAVGLDLGSTRIKGGYLDDGGRLHGIVAVDTPPASGEGPVREHDPEEVLCAANRLLDRLAAPLPPGVPLGLSCQRSTFTLWDPDTLVTALPLVSWQDRRADGWCTRNLSRQESFRRKSGLLLSPHYAAPKLATLFERDPELRRRTLRFGTLDTFCVARWTRGREHATDLSMAARTGLVDLADGAWSPELGEMFGVDASLLARILPSDGFDVPLENGLRLRAVVADQGAAACTVIEDDEVLVNLGTGGFALAEASSPEERREGCVTGPRAHRTGEPPRYCVEGSVPGVAAALDGGDDALRDILDRVRDVLDRIGFTESRKLYLAGGVSRKPDVARVLASLVGAPVRVLAEGERSLVGAARLAAGLPPIRRGDEWRLARPGPESVSWEGGAKEPLPPS